MPDLWSDLLDCLDLRPVPSGGTGDPGVSPAVIEFEGDDGLTTNGTLVASYGQEALLRFPGRDAVPEHA